MMKHYTIIHSDSLSPMWLKGILLQRILPNFQVKHFHVSSTYIIQREHLVVAVVRMITEVTTHIQFCLDKLIIGMWYFNHWKIINIWVFSILIIETYKSILFYDVFFEKLNMYHIIISEILITALTTEWAYFLETEALTLLLLPLLLLLLLFSG